MRASRNPATLWLNLHLVHPRLVSKRGKTLPILGSAHGSDLSNVYGPGELTNYLIHFATHLDPNGGSSPQWPQYTNASLQLMTFISEDDTTITQDTYRADAMKYITKIFLAHSL